MSRASILTLNEKRGIRDIVQQLAGRLEKQGVNSSIILDEIDNMLSRISRERYRMDSRDTPGPASLTVNHIPYPTRNSLLMYSEDAHNPNYRSLSRRLSAALWAYIFSFLPLIDLVSSSHVCYGWRSLIISTTQLWAHIVGLSGAAVGGLAVFLTRSKATPVHIELSANLDKIHDPAGLFVALAGHMWHTASLTLSFPSMAEYQVLQLQSALNKEAPILRRLCILSPENVRLSSNLFSRHSPRLTKVTLPILSLPDRCDALDGVVSFTSTSPSSSDVTHHDARKIFALCPTLKDLNLLAPFKDHTPLKGKPYTITTIVDNPLATLCLREYLASTAVYTLRTLNYESIKRITIPGISYETFQFLRKRMQSIEHLTFVRAHSEAHIILVDTDGSNRIFPSAPRAVVDALLKSEQSLTELTGLAITDTLRFTDAFLLRCIPCFTHLTSLTLFVGLLPLSDAFREIYDIEDQRDALNCPALRVLRMSGATPPGLDWIESAQQTPRKQIKNIPSVSIRKIASFVEASLGFSPSKKLRRLVLDGVKLYPSGSKTLEDLRMIIDDIVT